MPGGSAESYHKLGPIFESIAAQVDGTPCCVHVGPDAAGHFVKMVHNGIEYADMQLIAEAYDLLRHGLSADAAEIGRDLPVWNEGDLESFLVEITADVLAHVDAATGSAFVDVVLDQAEQKGTGRWTVQSALDLGVPITGIAEATFARALSGHAEQRGAAREAFGGAADPLDVADRDAFVEDVRRALYASKVVAYAQGFDHIAAGSDEYGWNIDRGAMATIWRGGCIIRARFLDRIREAYDDDPELPEPARGAVLRRRGARRGRQLAPGRGAGGGRRHSDAGVLLVARLLRRAAARPAARRAHPGTARQLRRAHLPAGRPGRHVPHRVGGRPPEPRRAEALRPERSLAGRQLDVAAELLAHRRQQLVGVDRLAAAAEPREQRGRQHRRRHALVDGGLDRPPALAGVRHPAGQPVQVRVGRQRARRSGRAARTRRPTRAATPR